MSKMEPLGDPARHFWMTRSVARVLGVSFSEAMASGHISQKEYADLVTRCRQCQFVDTCERWLAQQSTRAEVAPECCMHGDLFETLKQRAKEA